MAPAIKEKEISPAQQNAYEALDQLTAQDTISLAAGIKATVVMAVAQMVASLTGNNKFPANLEAISTTEPPKITTPEDWPGYIDILIDSKNPYAKNNGMPKAGKDKLFFEFEQNRRQLEIERMRPAEKTRAVKAMKNLNAKMEY